MKTENIITIAVIIILFSSCIKVYFKVEKDINGYINIKAKQVLIKDINFPNKLLMEQYL